MGAISLPGFCFSPSISRVWKSEVALARALVRAHPLNAHTPVRGKLREHGRGDRFLSPGISLTLAQPNANESGI